MPRLSVAELVSAVYCEIDDYASQWLERLIEGGHVAPGEVTGDIRAIDPDRIRGRQFHAFAGIGGWSYALRLAGVPDDTPVWTGSCPCQPFSSAGKRRGTSDERHLWPEFRRLIGECRPPIVFGEQVASPAGRSWLDAVSADLEALGYAVGAADLCAAGVGAPHQRQRLFWVAYLHGERLDGLRVLLRERGPQQDSAEDAGRGETGDVGDADGQGLERRSSERGHDVPELQTAERSSGAVRGFWAGAEWIHCSDGKARPTQPGAFPLAHGVPNRVGRLRAYGNAIVPQVAAIFIRAALEAMEMNVKKWRET